MKWFLFNPCLGLLTKSCCGRISSLCAAVGIGLLPLDAAPFFVTGWGANEAQQIEPPLTLTNAVAISAGFAHAIALRQDGSVVAWGDNAFGQTDVPGAATNLTAVAAGLRHSLAVRADGAVIGWGDDLFGQLNAPPRATGIVAIAAGATHSLALRSDATVVAWGGNSSGQTNVPGGLSGVRAIAAGAFHSLALRTNGTVSAWGYNGNGQITAAGSLTNVIAIAAGFNHSLALRSDGTVLAWGFNGHGQTNVPAGLSNVISIAAGLSHSLALRQDGTLAAWGGSPAGEAIIPEGLTNLQRVAAGGNFSLAITPGPALLRQPADARIIPGQTASLTASAIGREPLGLQWQKNGVDIPGATNATLTFPNAQYSDFGDFRLRVSDESGTVFSRLARLLSPPIMTLQPESVLVFYGAGVSFEVGVSGSDPFHYRWLTNSAGPTLGTNRSLSIASATYEQATEYWAVISNSVGVVTSLVARLEVQTRPFISVPDWLRTDVDYDGEIYLYVTTGGPSTGYQWQWNGLDIPGATNVLRFTGARPAHAGVYRFVVATPAGPVASSNLTVTVGRANPVQFAGRRLMLDAGDTFGLARSRRWFHEGVEIPNQTNATLLIEELRPVHAGAYRVLYNYDGGVERSFEVAHLTVLPPPPAGRIVSWGYTNQPPGMPITGIRDAVAVAMGDTHVLALRADGRVFQSGYLWQSSVSPWRALEPIVAISSKGSGAAVVGSSGRAASDTWSYCNPCGALETNRFIDVAFGGEYAIGLRNDGTAIGWGINGSGQASVPANLQGLVAVAAGAAHALALRNNGTVVAWGDNTYGQTSAPAGLSDVRAIASGWGHCLALRSNGVVVAWGQNSSGQRNVPVGLAGVVAIGSGPSQSFAIRSDGSVVAWGDDSYGQCTVPAGLNGVVAISGGTFTTSALVGSTNNPAILEHPVGGVVEIEDAFEFKVRAWSAAPLSYQWRRNGTNIAGAVGASLPLGNIQRADEGEYSVAVSTSAGTVVSDGATLFVNPAPFLTLPERGRLVVWGGQSSSAIPTALGEVAAISAGPVSFISYAIGTDGTAWGWNASFLVTLPDTNLVSVVPWYPNGDRSYLGLRPNGVVRGWSSVLEEIAPPAGLRNVVQLVGNGSGGYIAVRADGSIQHAYSPDAFPTNLSSVVQAALGEYHGVLLLRDGTLVLSRLGQFSEQTPVPDGLSNVVRVAAGAQHTLALRGDGTVVAWGRTREGQCAVPPDLGTVTAIAAGQNFSMALRSDGTVVVWGDDSQGQRLVPPALTNVVAIAAGSGHCLALQRGPVLVAPPTDLNIPPGQTATFQVTAQGAPPLRYQWLFQGETISGATNNSLNVLASQQSEGLYSVIVFNNDGAVSADAMLWLGLPPEILVDPEGGFIPVGESKIFMVLASGLAPLRYQWQFNGTNISGATNSSYGIFAVPANRGGDYRVIVANVFGAATSHVARLTVVAPPTIVTQPVSQTRVEGETAQFTVITAGGQPQAYQWRFNGSPLPGETNTLLFLAKVGTNDAGAYSVEVSNIVAAVTSASAFLTVVAPSPRFVVAPSNQVANFGATVLWNVIAVGASPLGYQWYFDDRALPGATDSSLTISNADRTVAGSYQVVVSNAFGSITSAPAQLILRFPPNVVIWGTNDLARAVPPDLTNAVAISAAGHVLALREDGTITAWGSNDQGQTAVPPGLSNVVAVAAGSGHSLALRGDGRVFAWGRNLSGETNVPVGLTNAIAIAAGSSHSVALRADGTLAGWGYDAYGQASPPAGLSNVVGVTANFESTLALKADGTVVEWGVNFFPPPGLSNVLAVMGRARMLALRSDGRIVGWGPGGGGFEGPAGIGTADSYWAPYTSGGATYIETHEIGLLTNRTVAIWGTNRGGIFTPPAGLSNVLAVSAGHFFNAAVLGGPVIVRQPQDLAAAIGSPASLTVQAVSRSPLQYQWRLGGTNLPGATNATLTFSALTTSNSGNYSVVVRDAVGPVVSRSARLRVLTDAPYVTRQPAGQLVNEGDRVSFHVEADGAEPLSYQWFHNGAPVNGATQNDFIIPTTASADAGVYAVRVSNIQGEVMSSPATLTLGIQDVIVDNVAAAVTGSWQTGNNAGQIGTNYLYIRQGWGANQVRFTPTLPRGGTYLVYSRFFTQSQPVLSPTLHVIRHSAGYSVVLPAPITGWSFLGTFNFAERDIGSVVALDVFPNGAALGVSDAVRFSYVPSPPVILFQPESVAVVEGTDLTLSVSVTGAAPLHYQWQFNSYNLVGANTDRLMMNAVDRSQAGSYRVLVSNTDGALYSREATVRVLAPPLQPSIEAGFLVLRWAGTATLQTATNVAGPFEDVPTAVSPVMVSLDERQRFFRLKR